MSDVEGRLLEDPATPRELRRALELRGTERLPDARRAALRASIAASLPPTPTLTPSKLPRMPVFGLVMGGVVVASLAGLALWARHSPAPRQREAPSVPPVHVAPLPAPVTSAPAQAEAPQPSVQGAPSQPATPARGAAIHSESRPRAQARALAPEDEIALIMEARRELRAGHTRRSLALLRRHRRRFTHGLLVQEREALTIEASLQARDVDGARRRAARFFLRYPGSALSARIRELTSDLENDNSTPTE